MAAVDIEHLVESSRNMESRCIAVGKFLAAVKLLECEPALVGEGIFHLVAVLPDVFRSESRRNLRQVHLGDTRERIHNLLALATELIIIRKMLPTATAAYGEVAASRSHADIRCRFHGRDMTLGIAFFLFVEFHIHDVSGSAERNEHDHIVDACESITLGCNIYNLHVFKHGERFTFSCHVRFQ